MVSGLMIPEIVTHTQESQLEISSREREHTTHLLFSNQLAPLNTSPGPATHVVNQVTMLTRLGMYKDDWLFTVPCVLWPDGTPGAFVLESRVQLIPGRTQEVAIFF